MLLPSSAPAPTSTGASRSIGGVYGVPETFVISKDGHIAHKHIGRLSSGAIEGTILPLIRRLQEQ